MPDWRDEVCSALDFWIADEGRGRAGGRLVNLGRMRRAAERGWFTLDVRTGIDTEQLDALRLSGTQGPDKESSYAAMEAVVEGPLLRVKVAEFVDLPDPHLWLRKQAPAFLLTKLRDGIQEAGGRAHDLAVGRLTAPPRVSRTIAGFSPAQQEAFESCLAPGLRLVWGPPGAGKTRVLTEAICALLTSRPAGRVLLVSATNIAVDNALLGVVRALRPEPGRVVRVGPPHHPEVARNPDVSLPHLVRDKLAAVEADRLRVEEKLLRLCELDDEVGRLERLVSGFDPEAYSQAAVAIAAEERLPALVGAVEAIRVELDARQADVRRSEDRLAAAVSRVEQVAGSRRSLAEVSRLEQELVELSKVADTAAHRALLAGQEVWPAEELRRADDGSLTARLGRRGRVRRLRAELDQVRARAAEHGAAAAFARDHLHHRRAVAGAEIARRRAGLAHSAAEIEAADAAVVTATRSAAQSRGAAGEAAARLTEATSELAGARSIGLPTEEQRTLVAEARRRRLPEHHQELGRAREAAAAVARERADLAAQYARIEKQFEDLRRDAEGEIISAAGLVATTLARLRTSRAVFEGQYDVVMVDEVGAANLPEVLLAVSRTSRTAVLLGDFLQLGTILPGAVQRADRQDVRRWLQPDVFAHCGVTDADSARANAGCTVLDIQHRFGHDVMGLANSVAYDGVLRAGPAVRARDPNDPEIVLIDVDGLGDVARVRPTGRRSGWWPAGALLTRHSSTTTSSAMRSSASSRPTGSRSRRPWRRSATRRAPMPRR